PSGRTQAEGSGPHNDANEFHLHPEGAPSRASPERLFPESAAAQSSTPQAEHLARSSQGSNFAPAPKTPCVDSVGPAPRNSLVPAQWETANERRFGSKTPRTPDRSHRWPVP